jgi:hypothetical protein
VVEEKKRADFFFVSCKLSDFAMNRGPACSVH